MQPSPEIIVCAIGDVVGRAGRQYLSEKIEDIRSIYNPDIFIVNGENSAGGFGITDKIFRHYTQELAIDVVTTGNHWHDKDEILKTKPFPSNLLLPANMYNVETITQGFGLFTTKKKDHSFAVINLLGRLFMKGQNRCPFAYADEILTKIPKDIKTIIVDFHAETTSEKQALAHYLSGRVSLLYGTHTHCPTADERIIDAKTGYITDLGMTGAFDSVIGMRKASSLPFFLSGERRRQEPAEGDPWLCGLIATINPKSGYCTKVDRLLLKKRE